MTHPPKAATGRAITALVLAGALFTGCSATQSTGSSADGAAAADASIDRDIFDSTTVQEIAVTVDPDDLAELLEIYQSTGEKEWATATVTIDGQTFEDVGIRLGSDSH